MFGERQQPLQNNRDHLFLAFRSVRTVCGSFGFHRSFRELCNAAFLFIDTPLCNGQPVCEDFEVAGVHLCMCNGLPVCEEFEVAGVHLCMCNGQPVCADFLFTGGHMALRRRRTQSAQVAPCRNHLHSAQHVGHHEGCLDRSKRWRGLHVVYKCGCRQLGCLHQRIHLRDWR